ncbi:MAG: hypothetical protein GWN79_25850, partial [Actinobacteria bacterium]|nr:hypothetical protein [Actinomycetota bacterium]NIT98646.1 hypothetical protein [Actinomycetota bacterium]NIU22262.1 hypothetical protein [Actinomycetota bacterium]NIX53622.1 hypothetical protein [Actinomycetota bacterium]
MTLFLDGSPVGSAIATSPVGFLLGPVPLADGDRLFTATAEDAAGNLSAPSAGLAVTIDTLDPLGLT